MTITTSDGVRYKMHHEQDCCENVAIEEIIGDINSILNKVVVVAEGTESNESIGYDSATRTDFLINTGDSEIVIRWLGESNGYYSEDVTFETID